MVHRTTDLFFVLKFKHRVFCGRFTRESHDTSHATPATSTREPTHPRVSACSKNIKIVSYHRVRGCRAYGLLPLWLLIKPFIDQACSVKMAGIWPRSFLASFFFVFMDLDFVSVHKHAKKKNLANDRTSLVNNPYVL